MYQEADMYKLRDWIHMDQLTWAELNFNPHIKAIQILEQHPQYIDWRSLSCNPVAIPLLRQHVGHVDWCSLSTNKGAIPLLQEDPSNVRWPHILLNSNGHEFIQPYIHSDTYGYRIHWPFIFSNPSCISIIEEHLDSMSEIYWIHLSLNKAAIHILEQHVDKINWVNLARNEAALPLIQKHWSIMQNEVSIDRIWDYLSANKGAISFLEEHIDKVNWLYASENEAAIHLLEKHPEHISWPNLSKNPGIFTYDYEAMKRRMKETIGEELMATMFHPKNYSKFAAWGFDEFTD